MSFAAKLALRSADVYADFLMPYVTGASHVLDVGCGSGTIAIGLAQRVGRVTGVDLREDDFIAAREYAATHAMRNVEFQVGDIYALDVPDRGFDACLCHSILETLDRPLDGLLEIKRTLRPGGVVAAACVEYGGLILAGPDIPLLRRFYDIRERLWHLERVADPYRGRMLRGLLETAGYARVAASSKYICYGTPDAVKSFGSDRAADCRDEWFSGAASEHGLATGNELESMENAWVRWAASSAAYAAFAWCRAIGWVPTG